MSPGTPVKRATRAVWWLLAAVALMVVLVLWTQYEGRVMIVDAQQQGCERGKRDRTDNAQAFRAQSDYLDLVLKAKSVHADVKRAARANQKVQDASATDLESRAGKSFDCAEVFPSPPFLPTP